MCRGDNDQPLISEVCFQAKIKSERWYDILTNTWVCVKLRHRNHGWWTWIKWIKTFWRIPMYCPLVIKPYWNPIQIPLNLIGSVWLGSPAGKAKCPSLRRFLSGRLPGSGINQQSGDHQEIWKKNLGKLVEICGNMGKMRFQTNGVTVKPTKSWINKT